MAFTVDQQKAIDEEGTNILVSAGAGSGKTAVLTERVIRKLKTGTHINELLIVTFTKASAFEMKERIRNAIMKDPSLSNELSLLDEAYITTFDSFTLSIVKKYHYQKNLSKDIKICDSSLLSLKKKNLCKQVLMTALTSLNPKVEMLIKDYCVKDTVLLEAYLLKIVNALEYKIDKKAYLMSYIDTYYSDEVVNGYVNSFVSYLKDLISDINSSYQDLSLLVDGDFSFKLGSCLTPLFNALTYEEIVNSFPNRLPSLKKDNEEASLLKDELSKKISSLKDLCSFSNSEELINSYLLTKPYADAIIFLVTSLDKMIDDYKEEKEMYDFSSIVHLAISILKDNDDIRKEVSNSFKEILIDEYQDTNDLQEALMALIVNNNNYMVGDIKQAIYRFRQANPYIFKNKYDSYSKHIGGEKIDLVKNFRSRKEVLDTVNDVFESIMDDFLGGADYKNGHCMVFGNKNYEELGNNDLNHHLSIYQYENNSLEYSNPLIEVFLIAKDILKKIKDEYTIFDKDTNTLRRAVFSDFAILMDRATNFSLYKKVFEYLHIPLTVITDSKLTSNIELDVIKNLFKIVIATKNNCFDNSFKHALVSVLRSFLIKMSDDDIYKLIASNGYLTSSFYDKIKEIVLTYDFLGANDLLDKLLSTFNYYDNLISLGNVEEGITRIFYIKSLIKDLALNGYSILDVYNYLEDVLKGKLEIKYKEVVDENNAVKIMTIHKSKGLEYPLCYFSGLSSPFNIRDIQEKMLIDQKYGLILPYKDDYLRQSFVLSLVKKNYMEEEISEKIRLFYVALTRAKEKIIFILPKGKEKELKTDEIGVIVNTTRLKYRSFKDMLNSIYEKLLPYVEEINVSELNITKEYLNSNIEKMDLTSSIKLDVKEEPLPQIAKGKESFSKQNKMVIKKDENMARLLGIHFHEILEYIDFFKPLPYLKDEDTYIKDKVLAFLNSSFLKSLDIEKIVREYSFIENDTIGRIDLIIFTKKTQIIIDYKLKNIKDEAYIKQLNGYKTFLKTKDKRVVKMYLYSIIDEMFYELEG